MSFQLKKYERQCKLSQHIYNTFSLGNIYIYINVHTSELLNFNCSKEKQ